MEFVHRKSKFAYFIPRYSQSPIASRFALFTVILSVLVDLRDIFTHIVHGHTLALWKSYTIAPLPVKWSRRSWASCQIRKITGCACAGNAGNVFSRRRLQRKTLVRDPGMNHSTCVTHVPWCMSGSLTRGGGGNVPGISGACAPTMLRIW